MCEKVTYDSFFDAEKSISRHKKGRAYGNSARRMATKVPKRAYKCNDCGKYHITSMLKKK